MQQLKEQLVEKVDFNINPDYAKPTATVRASDLPLASRGAAGTPRARGGSPRFEFEYAMARTFPCVMTVHFHRALRLPPVRIDYRVSHDPRLAPWRVMVPLDGASDVAARSLVVVEAEPPRDGRVCFAGGSGVFEVV